MPVMSAAARDGGSHFYGTIFDDLIENCLVCSSGRQSAAVRFISISHSHSQLHTGGDPSIPVLIVSLLRVLCRFPLVVVAVVVVVLGVLDSSTCSSTLQHAPTHPPTSTHTMPLFAVGPICRYVVALCANVQVPDCVSLGYIHIIRPRESQKSQNDLQRGNPAILPLISPPPAPSVSSQSCHRLFC